jgi:vacuolar-type H+-ATPase subunit I/STV1
MRNENIFRIEEHERRIDGHQKIIDDHVKIVAKGDLSLKILKWVQPIFLGAMVYSYTLIADLRDQVREQSIVLPRLEQIMNTYGKQSDVIAKTEEEIKKHDDKLEEIDSDVEHIKKLKVVRGSR